ncbi:MAG: hypothetical protein AAF492_25505, partial [Verrucomicrobiota bacterium]
MNRMSRLSLAFILGWTVDLPAAPPVARLGSQPFTHHDPLDHLSFSPDRSSLFALSSDEACLWDLETGEKRAAFRLESSIMSGVLSADGRTVVLAENGPRL